MVFEDLWTYSTRGRQRRLEFWRHYSPHVYDNLFLHYSLKQITDLQPAAVIALSDIEHLNDWARTTAVAELISGTKQTALSDFLSDVSGNKPRKNATAVAEQRYRSRGNRYRSRGNKGQGVDSWSVN